MEERNISDNYGIGYRKKLKPHTFLDVCVLAVGDYTPQS